jgi:hypothetical protein
MKASSTMTGSTMTGSTTVEPRRCLGSGEQAVRCRSSVRGEVFVVPPALY